MNGPMMKRDMISIAAHGWASRTSCAEIDRRRMAVFQSVPAGGTSMSPSTRSVMPSRMSSLLATWLYSDIASTPSSCPSLRMVSDSIPLSSASATAARSTRSLLKGARRSAFEAVSVDIGILLALGTYKVSRRGGPARRTGVAYIVSVQRKYGATPVDPASARRNHEGDRSGHLRLDGRPGAPGHRQARD